MYEVNLNSAMVLITGTGDAIVTSLEAGPGGPLKRKLLIAPGTVEAWDECDCGILIQTLVRTYYSQIPLSGEAAQDGTTNACTIPYVNFDVATSLGRCVHVGTEDGRPPKEAHVISNGILDLQERYLLRSMVNCVMSYAKENDRVAEYFIGEQVGVGPSGGCAGSTLRWGFALANRCPCG